jgi:hypothetical protein
MAPAFCFLAGVGLAEGLRRRLPARLLPAGLLGLAGAFAMIPLICTVRDVAHPYYSIDEETHRKVARTLAARTSPDDEWLLFNGLERMPVADRHLMLQPWLQQEAEFRFCLLQQARCPLRPVYNPFQVKADPSRKTTWLIVHKPGFDNFPENVKAALIEQLTRQRTPPRHFTFRMSGQETIEVYAFPQLDPHPDSAG